METIRNVSISELHDFINYSFKDCIGMLKQKQRKELQERIMFLGRKLEKMKAELSNVLLYKLGAHNFSMAYRV